MSDLLTQAQVQAEFDAASEADVSPCMWIPPTWQDLQTAGGRLIDNSADEGPFTNPQGSADAKARIQKGDAKLAPEGPERPPDDAHWTNAFADFSHQDEEDFPGGNLDLINNAVDSSREARRIDPVLTAVARIFKANRKAIVEALDGNQDLFGRAVDVLQGDASVEPGELQQVVDLLQRPGEVQQACAGGVTDAVAKLVTRLDLPSWTLEDVVNVLKGTRQDLLNRRNALNRLTRIVGPGQPGMKRLALVFEWALYRATVLMNDINQALNQGRKGEDAYNEARLNYINFLKDLDDRQPEKSDTPPLDVRDKKARSGYGRAMKWNCIDPVIFQGRIVGARAVIRWNPHSSSSGFPIPH